MLILIPSPVIPTIIMPMRLMSITAKSLLPNTLNLNFPKRPKPSISMIQFLFMVPIISLSAHTAELNLQERRLRLTARTLRLYLKQTGLRHITAFLLML